MTARRQEVAHVRLSEGPCECHEWPTEGLAKRLVELARERHGMGGVEVCRDCIARAHREQAERIAALDAKKGATP